MSLKEAACKIKGLTERASNCEKQCFPRKEKALKEAMTTLTPNVYFCFNRIILQSSV